MTTETPPPLPELTDPARAEYLRQTLTQVVALLVQQMLSEVGSTDSPSPGDRLMLAALRPWIPKLQTVLLSKLSEVDPLMAERILGATATACESILAQAPGTPLPRYRAEWDADAKLVLVPL